MLTLLVIIMMNDNKDDNTIANVVSSNSKDNADNL